MAFAFIISFIFLFVLYLFQNYSVDFISKKQTAASNLLSGVSIACHINLVSCMARLYSSMLFGSVLRPVSDRYVTASLPDSLILFPQRNIAINLSFQLFF